MSWQQITCDEREALVDRLGRSYNGFSDESGIGVLSAFTDMDGWRSGTGRAYVLTEWGYRATETPVLRDERWPNSDRTCEHYQWEGDR
jgi:hypothetical protein